MMPTVRVFAFFADIQPAPSTRIDPAITDGRHVYCYVGARDARAATARLEQDLHTRGLRLARVQWCVDQDRLVRDEPAEPSAAAAEQQAREGRIVYQPIAIPQ